MADIYNKRVAHYRNMKNLKQAEVAEKLGMKNSTYSQLERKGRIGVEQLVKIADILDISVLLLLYGEELAVLGGNEPNIAPEGDKGNKGRLHLGQEPDFGFGNPSPLPISPREENLIKVFRKISKEGQDEVIALLDRKRIENKKNK